MPMRSTSTGSGVEKKREREGDIWSGEEGLGARGKKKEVMDVSWGGEKRAPIIEARGEVRVRWEPARVRRGKTVREEGGGVATDDGLGFSRNITKKKYKKYRSVGSVWAYDGLN